jgi:hypothetical protein
LLLARSARATSIQGIEMIAVLHAELVELQTEIGSIYVRPLGWERLYMLWTFRHFHSLPRQVLNPKQRFVIESLCRSAVANPQGEVEPWMIIGSVENVPVMGPLAAAITEVQPRLFPDNTVDQLYEAEEYARVSSAPEATSIARPVRGPALQVESKSEDKCASATVASATKDAVATSAPLPMWCLILLR